MKSFKQKTRHLFDKLFASWFGRQVLSQEEEARCLLEINESNDPASVAALLGLLCSGRPSVGDTAAGTIQQIVDATDPAALAGIDLEVREMSIWRLPLIKAPEVNALSRGLTGPLGVISCHPSGFVREAAVVALANVTDGQELPFLLIRLNDWVLPVRDAARTAIQARIVGTYVEHFIHCLPLVYGLQTKGRVDHGPVFNAIISLVRMNEARPALRRAALGANRVVSRLAFRLLVEESRDDVLQILTDALVSKDAVLRLWAARDLRNRLQGEPLRNVLERLAKDRFAPIRREALYGYVEKLPDLASEFLRSALLDPHTSIRETARYFLAKSGWTDFISFYAAHFTASDDNVVAAAVAGIGETGKAADAELVTRFLSHANKSVRCAAVRAVGHLDADGFKDTLHTALNDERPSVAKAAREVLVRHMYLLTRTSLSAAFERAPFPHTRALVLSLIAALQWWDSAILLIAATAASEEKIRELAVKYLHQWQGNCNRLTVRPSEDQLRLLNEALAHNRWRLDSKSLNDLDEHLRLAMRDRV